jgi:hypothetical protein
MAENEGKFAAVKPAIEKGGRPFSGNQVSLKKKWIAQRRFAAQRIKMVLDRSLGRATKNALRIGCQHGATHPPCPTAAWRIGP